MKYFGLLIALFSALNSFSQSPSDLFGIWKIEKIVNNTKSSVPDCMESATQFKLTFNSDGTYSFDAGPGYVTTGKWKIEKDKLNFYNNKLSDSSKGTVADHSYPFEFESENKLIIDEYICSELGGKTHYIRN